ncbi:MAG TPA: hypothetical protein PLX06_01730 [Fimbriimonadaceae bacterium]|nr:hypothetical protein [Fimbriimonadaceae bacterium]
MTLKKDALVAVSIAGVVLAMAGASSQVGRSQEEAKPDNSVLQKHDRDILQLYIDSINAQSYLGRTESSVFLTKARKTLLSIWQSDRKKNPIDHFRAAAILKTSENPKELALAHELSLVALTKGIKVARKVVLEAEDRLLLSTGNRQRYGTQQFWNGQELASFGKPANDIDPQLQDTLGVRNMKLSPINR